ncbi:HMG1/2 box-containing protein [Heterostelium album PN500]|uniref:HMG1/2 box-containing protein n=1 Tax=Heterostelium pallidum (strain ATCC 26659 / Pp 5 / PN500) TaxID=670386 RepID=D3BLT3_HETP5|nr:HMG1/2 box-containing protein [Heterostelium album PN500]EFA77534.1 HMG1/2 box-containing protein [Heterostelium album PN500]|eukprot:XP_020429662.1 HMG1/2 box-containing protein [Heterostelium album PN500]
MKATKDSNENPAASFTEIGSLLGKKWHSLSAPEKDVYQKRSDEEKRVYELKMKEYKAMISQQQPVKAE